MNPSRSIQDLAHAALASRLEREAGFAKPSAYYEARAVLLLAGPGAASIELEGPGSETYGDYLSRRGEFAGSRSLARRLEEAGYAPDAIVVPTPDDSNFFPRDHERGSARLSTLFALLAIVAALLALPALASAATVTKGSVGSGSILATSGETTGRSVSALYLRISGAPLSIDYAVGCATKTGRVASLVVSDRIGYAGRLYRIHMPFARAENCNVTITATADNGGSAFYVVSSAS